MWTSEQRHQMIGQALLPRPGAQADAGMLLWHKLATELSLIIGKRGFESLYARSLSRASAAHPWLQTPTAHESGDVFDQLGANLMARESAEAHAANAALLCIFTDILIVLIGELLTNSILRKAWGDDVVDHAGTE